jgi:hypothetical protein
VKKKGRGRGRGKGKEIKKGRERDRVMKGRKGVCEIEEKGEKEKCPFVLFSFLFFFLLLKIRNSKGGL